MNIKHIILAAAALLSASAAYADAVIRMIGDSTMADKDLAGGNPERGWGMMLPAFFDETVSIDNHAQNGRSTKSFMEEGRWDKVKEVLKKGDYVFIEFGHNDQPGKPGRSTEVGKDFDENLRTYVREARAAKAIPVLFTPIARRKFSGDSLVDTHGAYTQALRDVAAELDVPCIDLNTLTSEWLRKLGPEESKKYFMHVDPGTVIKCPEGKKDDTHLNARGARAVARMATQEIVRIFPKLASHARYYDIVVAKDGSGDFMTVQEAVNAAPDYNAARTDILVREGVYREKIVVPESKRNLTVTGQGNVVLSWDNCASRPAYTGREIGTTGSATVFVLPDNFVCENITFENTAGMNAGQAVACLVGGDRAVFRNCRFLGYQDTLYTYGKGQYHYFQDCYIEGSVDFIFGPSTALFNRCEIRCKRDKGYITAPSTPQGTRHGYVFYECRLTADNGIGGCYLSRPWRDYGQTVYIRCDIGGHIAPEGWHNWRNPAREKTAFYAEYGNTGAGAKTDRRAFGRVLASLDDYNLIDILGGWEPDGCRW